MMTAGGEERSRLARFKGSEGEREVEFVDRRAGVVDLSGATPVIEILGRVQLSEEEMEA